MYISEIRKQKGYSQKYVAEAVDVSQNALCQYEKGKRKPSPELLLMTALALSATEFAAVPPLSERKARPLSV